MFDRVSLRFSCLWNPGVCPANRRDPLLSGLPGERTFPERQTPGSGGVRHSDGQTGSLAARVASLVRVQQIL
jgi:hypothetical protein